jgi:hypothetical protein
LSDRKLLEKRTGGRGNVKQNGRIDN